MISKLRIMNYYSRSHQDTLEALGSSIDGLSSQKAKKRLELNGKNQITVKGTPLWRKLVEPFLDVFTAVLAVAVIISVWHHDYVDAIIIAVIILASAIIYYVQRFSADRVLKALQKSRQDSVDVMRDGQLKTIPATDIVAGDVIVLTEGDKIPADARLLTTSSFRVDESQLTGESLPIEKSPKTLKSEKPIYEQTNMVFQGSFVVSGTAHAVVTSTGNKTEFGKLAELSSQPVTASPVQQKIDALITRIIFIIIAVSLVALALSLRQGMDIYESIRFVIALAVSAVPEGLPIAISVVLVLGMRRMAVKKALARTMRSIETLGTVTTIATDKTGTLTENKLSVKEIWGLRPKDNDLELCMERSLNITHQKTHDPLDRAIRTYLESEKSGKISISPLVNFPFDQSLTMSGNEYHHGEGFALYVKGRPEKIIECSKLTALQRKKIITKLDEYTSRGYRVIAFASIEHKHQISSLNKISDLPKLKFSGLVAVADSLRKEAKAAIAQATSAGVTVRMITGDHFETAYFIGKELGLVTSRDQVFDSSKLSQIDEAELESIVAKTRVFSRVVPEDKHHLLSVLKKHDITAMTGDGVNDVPALTNAHVGIAMGSGTSIAKDAGDIILIDDNFKTIVAAIKEGRTIFTNIKLMVAYLLSTNAGEVILNIGALMLGVPIPLLPVQILWVNLVTDTSMVIPLGLEPGDRNIMKKPPFPPKAPLLARFMVIRTLIIAVVVGGLTLGMYLYFLNSHGADYARTIAFMTIIVTQWSNALAMRSNDQSVFEILKKPSKAFWIGLGASFLLQMAAIFTPLAGYLHIAPVSMIDLGIAVVIGTMVPILAIELHKIWCNKTAK